MDILKHIEQKIKEGSTTKATYNNIDYYFITEGDGWISIIERNPLRGYIPLLQACNMAKATDYCAFREPAPSFLNKF